MEIKLIRSSMIICHNRELSKWDVNRISQWEINLSFAKKYAVGTMYDEGHAQERIIKIVLGKTERKM